MLKTVEATDSLHQSFTRLMRFIVFKNTGMDILSFVDHWRFDIIDIPLVLQIGAIENHGSSYYSIYYNLRRIDAWNCRLIIETNSFFRNGFSSKPRDVEDLPLHDLKYVCDNFNQFEHDLAILLLAI